MSLHIDLRVGQSVSIDNGRVVMTLKDKSGKKASLEFDADKSVRIQKLDGHDSAHVAAGGLSDPVLSTG